MAKILQKEISIKLRKKGASIKDIAKKVNVSNSTVSYWCKNIILSANQVKKLEEKRRRAGLKGSLIFSETQRKKRILREEKYTHAGSKDIGMMSKRDMFILGVGLYWGEGYKKGNNECGLTNSDPAIILLIIKWFQETYHTSREDYILRVSINQIHKERDQKIKKYWSKTTGIPLSQFTKTSFINASSKKAYSNNEDYFGTLRIKVRRGLKTKLRILGSIETCKLKARSSKL